MIYLKLHVITVLLISTAFPQTIKPSWVIERPNLNDYYIGIVQVEITSRSESDYIEKANNLAFKEISEQIRVSVASEFKSFTTDTSGYAKSLLYTVTISELEGIEKVATYSDEKFYWVYWKLSKNVHQKSIRKFTLFAKKFYRNSQKHQGNPVQELSNLIKSYESVFRAYGEIVVDTLVGREIILNTRIPTRIELLLSGIDIQGRNTRQTGTEGSRLDGVLILRAKYHDKPLTGLPVHYWTVIGEAEYQPEQVTDNRGECRVSVNKILSDLSDQEIRAQIDLVSLLQYPDKNPLLKEYLTKLTEKWTVSYHYSVSGLAAENIAVKVIPQDNISNNDANWINEQIISELIKTTNFRVMERDMMDKILQEQKFNANCSSTECLVEAGKRLSVKKMLYVIIGKSASESFFRGIFKFINIETAEIEYQKSVKFIGSYDKLLDQGIPEWVNEFYISLNQPHLTFTSSIHGIQISKDKEPWAKIPVYQRSLPAGSHHLSFEAEGYETVQKQYRLLLGMNINEDIRLAPKTKGKALVKSLLFPGLGQFYTSDANHGGRYIAGTLISATGVVSIAITAISWSQYFTARKDYTNANQEYLSQKQLDQIVQYRKVARHKNDHLAFAEKGALIYTGVLTTIWLGNALEAVLHFPDYQNKANLSSTFQHSKVQFQPGFGMSYQYTWDI